MSDEEEFLFNDLPREVQQKVVNNTDPYDLPNDDYWFESEKEYFQEWFYEMIEGRLSKYETKDKAWRKFNSLELYYDQPRGQGPYYAFFTKDFDLDWVAVQSFIETADTIKQNGIVNNSNLQFFEADKMAYGKSHIAPNLSGDAETITFSIRISPIDLRSEQMSSLTSYDNFPYYIEEFKMQYVHPVSKKKAIYEGGWGHSGGWVQDDPDTMVADDAGWEVVDEQVKPVYMWIDSSLKKGIYEWIIGMLAKISDGMTKQSDYQVSKERVWDYYETDEETYFDLDGDKV